MLYQLPSSTIAAGAIDTIPLRGLPKAIQGRIPHVRRFIIDVTFTPTFTTAPTQVGNHSVLAQCDFWDGRINRFTGNGNALRARERMYGSRVRIPDPQTDTASASARYLRRVLHCGPPVTMGADTDFLIPTGALENGEIRLRYGALTDLSADTTALTGTVKVYADLVLMDEVRVPPAVQFLSYAANSADYAIPGRALYLSIFALNSSSYDAISAGDFGNWTVDLGAGDIVPTIPGSALHSAYMDDMDANEVNTYMGEPRGSTDNNARQVNHASQTALAACAVDLQPVLWLRKGQKLTKCPMAETAGRIKWDGSQSSAVLLVERILSQPGTVVGAVAADALAGIKRNAGKTTPKTMSKDPYNGPLGEFFPWKVSVR